MAIRLPEGGLGVWALQQAAFAAVCTQGLQKAHGMHADSEIQLELEKNLIYHVIYIVK